MVYLHPERSIIPESTVVRLYSMQTMPNKQLNHANGLGAIVMITFQVTFT